MKVGILGTGDVARALGAGFAKRGHEVRIGSRDPAGDKAKAAVQKIGPKATAGTFAEAAQFGDVVVLATLWKGTENALKLAGGDRLAGKVVIDATNPLDFDKGVPPTLAIGHTTSSGEQVQAWIPRSRVVKAFNIVGNAAMVDPQFPGGPPDMFICGNDPAAKQTVTDICTSFGWPTTDLGGIEMSRYLDPLAMVWIIYGFKTNTWNHAFKLLRK
ncbi:MAG TPA: NADPH-dependent F420 reductase [Gemmatimonadales bacterium]|nr:NADPH-dependent F420 reductase [Gemmatimonadales bacterium]